ncbi:carboxypeptidase-like regulatory domain-containing protein [Rubinisphaera sp. JC750]|uniref:carboxypeptidase-like regulatory domain-containing protein n=1 Tax=Rubinisphaera sp. JC750 TaxID=2898658 RepID=UPI001F33D35F|nr:carboxypeptidase-like regulatory domain-containing protein [Rubinisphaera sp. JC750]
MKKLITGFACLCLAFAPAMQAGIQAAESKQNQSQINDVALSSHGTLKGQAVDGQGQPLTGAKVNVLQNKKVVGSAVTTQEGKFEVTGLSTGIYEVQAGQGKGMLRAWDSQVAPPTAKHNVLIVSGATTRAQAGLFIDPLDTITLGLAITGTALGAAALAKDNETIIVSP